MNNIGYPCPEGFNQTDHFLDIISIDFRSEQLHKESR